MNELFTNSSANTLHLCNILNIKWAPLPLRYYKFKGFAQLHIRNNCTEYCIFYCPSSPSIRAVIKVDISDMGAFSLNVR